MWFVIVEGNFSFYIRKILQWVFIEAFNFMWKLLSTCKVWSYLVLNFVFSLKQEIVPKINQTFLVNCSPNQFSCCSFKSCHPKLKFQLIVWARAMKQSKLARVSVLWISQRVLEVKKSQTFLEGLKLIFMDWLRSRHECWCACQRRCFHLDCLLWCIPAHNSFGLIQLMVYCSVVVHLMHN